jgi:Ca2+-binding EF-hand superfamily protein
MRHAMQDALREVGENPDPGEIKSIINGVDKNGDGQIDYEEFCSM